MRRSLLFPSISLSLVLLMLVACGTPAGDVLTDDSQSPSSPAVSTDDRAGDAHADAVLVIEEGVADGPGISVTEALGWEGDPTPVLVNGALFVDEDGNARLCEAIAESFPPQCGGARLLVEGLDLAGIPHLEEANGVRWSESVQLLGRVERAD